MKTPDIDATVTALYEESVRPELRAYIRQILYEPEHELIGAAMAYLRISTDTALLRNCLVATEPLNERQTLALSELHAQSSELVGPLAGLLDRIRSISEPRGVFGLLESEHETCCMLFRFTRIVHPQPAYVPTPEEARRVPPPPFEDPEIMASLIQWRRLAQICGDHSTVTDAIAAGEITHRNLYLLINELDFLLRRSRLIDRADQADRDVLVTFYSNRALAELAGYLADALAKRNGITYLLAPNSTGVIVRLHDTVELLSKSPADARRLDFRPEQSRLWKLFHRT